jgi:hypothetical protein
MSATGSFAQRARLIGLIDRRAPVVGTQNPECDIARTLLTVRAIVWWQGVRSRLATSLLLRREVARIKGTSRFVT